MTAAELKALYDAAKAELTGGHLVNLTSAILNNLPAIIEAMEDNERMAGQLAEVTAAQEIIRKVGV